MTHDAAVAAINGAIYRAEENLESAHSDAQAAAANANRAKAAWEKQREDADRKRQIAAGYREEISQLLASKSALTVHANRTQTEGEQSNG